MNKSGVEMKKFGYVLEIKMLSMYMLPRTFLSLTDCLRTEWENNYVYYNIEYFTLLIFYFIFWI